MEMDIRISVGNKIKELRRERNLSQEELALLSGLDRTYINSVENGRRNISIISLEKIANGLRVKIRNIF
ncbi:DNA-binding transcriptional regulator, XRE-family HTH domain [Desulfosporosinus lacus DSM 15449]|uniref:DNA-binding transcriptional regulator, XRE-family HTH domain n=2 Tax=Desulfosporosinus TaxID=79206 RepID=A0A1M5QH87_9FIRM|nr:helix-turn-helix transcriptional regulator [Desulfosporosinus lacus]SHH13139.1 DNA-binding transcriptional regulator, XRE-family HTH domain [Desulfosporosinus lacus DSM 15449]